MRSIKLTKDISGQITVFSAIIMAGVLLLAGLLVDIARINTGRNIIKRAVESAASSVLAEYSSQLKNHYGLFALPNNNTALLEDQFEEYLACNLSIPIDDGTYYEGSSDMFGFRIEKIKVTPIYNLSENEVTKKQILEYMKYRAPEELIEGFLERLTSVNEVGKMADAYKQKVSIDKILGSMDKSQQNLKKSIDGLGNSADKFVNGFNLNGCWESAFSDFNSMTSSLVSVQDSLRSIDSSISNLESELADLKDNNNSKDDNNSKDNTNSGRGNTSSSSSSFNNSNNVSSKDNSSVSGQNSSDSQSVKEKELKDMISSLKGERKALSKSKSDMEKQLNKLWNNIRDPMTSEYKKSNESAMREIRNIVEKGRKAQQAITELEKYLDENFSGDDGSFSKGFREQVQTELDSLKELILQGRKAEEMLEVVGENKSILENIISTMDGTKKLSGGLPPEGLPSELLDVIEGYSAVNYDYIRPTKGDKMEDPRKGKSAAANETIYGNLFDDVSYEASGISKESLPSFTKVMTDSFDLLDHGFIEAANVSGQADISCDSREAVYKGDLENVVNDEELYNEESKFQENVLGFIADIGELAADQAIGLRDSIYINEYIMGTFKNSVPALKSGTEIINDVNLHGIEKADIETFYDSEAEYILHGQASQKANIILTKGELLLVRSGLNTLHVYMDPAKKARATVIAASVAGWWTGGAGIPLLTNLIMCGWGLGESVIDVIDLMDGKSVPIYKMKGDWKLDIGIASEAGPSTDQRFYFSYHDYLRLFLLAVSEDKKLSRIEDLIQLNMGKYKDDPNGFRMTGCHTYVRIEAEVSMKYMFMTQPFVRKELKTGDGRYIYRVLVYEGY